MKPRWAVEEYERLLNARSTNNMVELGILEGGSTALLAELARPQKLVAIDIREHRSAALDQWVHAQALDRRVVPEFGIDQADTERVTRVVEREFGDQELDLVIDDASHELGPTRKSFDCLFPRLAADGIYVIEDWWTSLAPLMMELVIVAASQPKVIANGSLNRFWVVLHRGVANLDRASFDLSSLLLPREQAFIANFESLERQTVEEFRTLGISFWRGRSADS
jgi:hypothetical protein